MQAVNDSPRGAISAAVVNALLQSVSVVRIGYGATWLDSNLNVIGDLTEYMSEGSSIIRDSTALIQGTCTLLLDGDSGFNPLTDFIQPYMILTDPNTGSTATFNLGVYTLDSPEYDNSGLPSVVTYSGYDLNYYLNFPVGDSYVVAAGSDPIDAAVTVLNLAFPNATVEFDETASVTTTDMVWPSGAQDPYNTSNSQITYLAIINDLLAVVGYAPVWVDWNGKFQLRAYVSPGDSEPEYIFDMTADDNIVAEPRTSTQDLFDIPNQWQFIMSDLTAEPVEGTTQFTYQDFNENNPSSIPNRGGRIIPATYYVTAADYDSLVAIGLQQIVLDLQPAEQFSVTTSPFPLAWQYDIITLIDPNLVQVPPLLSTTRQVVALQWNLPLDGTSDMSWILQTATQ